MKPDLNHHSIKQLLDRSTSQIEPSTLHKLQAARMHALEHHQERHRAPVLAWPGQHGSHRGSAHHLPRRLNWALAVLLLACLFSGIAYWQHSDSDHDTSEEDIAILTDDLPLHVYVD